MLPELEWEMTGIARVVVGVGEVVVGEEYLCEIEI